MTGEEPEPIPLHALNGAAVSYTDSGGERVRVGLGGGELRGSPAERAENAREHTRAIPFSPLDTGAFGSSWGGR